MFPKNKFMESQQTEKIPNGSTSKTPTKKSSNSGRLRTSMACDWCSKLRQKCNGENPCSSCILKSRECRYTRKKSRRGPPKLNSLLAAKRMLEEQLMVRSMMQSSTIPSIPSSYPQQSGSYPAQNQAQHIYTVQQIGGMVSCQSMHVSASTTKASFEDPKTPLHFTKATSIPLLQHHDFRLLLVWDQSSWSYFLEYYFQHMHRSFPFLTYEWFKQNMDYIPLYYLHAMYACCLISASSQVTIPPNQSLLSVQAAHAHYKQSLQTILQDLDSADPFTVAALYHLFTFALYSPDVSDKDAILHYTLAARLCQLLEIWKPDFKWMCFPSAVTGNNDESTPSTSSSGKLISFPRFSLGIWFAVQILDIRVISIFGIDSFLKPPIDLKNLGYFYLSPLSLNNSNQGSLYHDHDLALIDYNLPLINIIKQVTARNEYVDDVLISSVYSQGSLPDQSLKQSLRDILLLQESGALKMKLDQWFANLPPGFQLWPGQNVWKGAHIMELNCMYHISSIFLYISLKDDRIFLPASDSGDDRSKKNVNSIDPATSCLISANMIATMAQTLNQQFSNFLSISSSLSTTQIPLSTLLYLEYAIFISALTLCAFNSNINQTKLCIEYHLLYALRICGASCAFVQGPMTRDSITFDPDIIRSCIGYPDRAILLLRQRMIGDRNF